MSINLFFYVSKPYSEVKEIIDQISARRQDLFSSKFVLYPVKDVGSTGKEIALEYNLRAQSLFLVRLGDKNFAHCVEDVANILKDALGQDCTLVLFENERKM